jgi:Tol biopolymer transport system component
MDVSASAHAGSRDEVAPPLVRAELARILASDLFVRSDRLSAFLSFIVSRTLDGQGESLKELTIALELYGKGPDFSTAADPIVRVDARRLRDKLREYYATHPDAAIVIEVPKGSYTPMFHDVAAPGTAPRLTTPAPATAGGRSRRSWLLAAAALAVSAAAFWGFARLRMEGNPDIVRLLTVTSLPGAEEDPSLSPDGNYVVFSWNSSATQREDDIWLKAVDSDELIPLTRTADAIERFPRWSPDGRSVLFTRILGSQISLFTVSRQSGREKLIVEGGANAAWAPDGQSIVMVLRMPGAPHGLVHYELGTGARLTLTDPPAGVTDVHPRVSPDGLTVAFQRSGAGRSAIHTVPVKGGEPSRISEWFSGPTGGLEWTPDGREILFPRPETSGRRLVRMPIDRSGDAVPVTAVPHGAIAPSASAFLNGRGYRLAVVNGQPDIGLRLIDFAAARRVATVAADSPFCDATRMDTPGRFSPDGSQIAFASDRGGSHQIWIANRDGSDLRSVTTFPDAIVNPGSWSPDSQWLTFEATIRGATHIYRVRVNGGPTERVTSGTAMEIDPEWSRDGRWIYFAANESGASAIWKVPAGGGEPRRLTSDVGYEPRESSDGRSVYFIDRHRSFGLGPPGALKRVSTEGGAAEVIDLAVMPGAWEVTDAGIVFLSSAGAAGQLQATPPPNMVQMYDFAERKVRDLGELAFPVGPYGTTRYLTVSRDGRWAVATHIDRWDRDIFVVDRFK